MVALLGLGFSVVFLSGILLYQAWQYRKLRSSRTSHLLPSCPVMKQVGGYTDEIEKNVLPLHRTESSDRKARIPREILQMEKDKQLYHSLLNLDKYPESLPAAHARLLTLFDEVLSAANTPSSGSLLSSVPEYDQQELDNWLRATHDDASVRYEQYVSRRNNGGQREMFNTRADAVLWLKQAAPVKYVDGAWLQNVHRITTLPELRDITQILWQVMSEELGDGDLAKNHIWLYEKLMRDESVTIPPAHDVSFIDPSQNLNDPRVWKAALSQLLISLFPKEYLPEVLGFVMSYETLPYHLLVTIFELKELKIDPYYFVLHVAIDNADSGHGRMCQEAVHMYIESFPEKEREGIWKRILVGFSLADGLPTTPDYKRYALERGVGDILHRKSMVSQKLHAASRARICGEAISSWLRPDNFATEYQQQIALGQLEESKVWLVPGDPVNSRLLKEFRWGGPMFGAMSQDEMLILEEWVTYLGAVRKVDKAAQPLSYTQFIGRPAPSISLETRETMKEILEHPSAPRTLINIDAFGASNRQTNIVIAAGPLDLLESLRVPDENTNNFKGLKSLYLVSLGLLETVISPPSKCADESGMLILDILRTIQGFPTSTKLQHDSGCPGMDVTHFSSRGLWDLAGGQSRLDAEHGASEFLAQLLCFSSHYHVGDNRHYLLGMALAAAALLHQGDWLENGDTVEMKRIANREVALLTKVIDLEQQIDARCMRAVSIGYSVFASKVFESWYQF